MRRFVALASSIVFASSLAVAAPPPGESAFLDGMHDVDAAPFLASTHAGCDQGWLTDLQYVGTSGSASGDCHDAAVAKGVSIIQRLDVSGSDPIPYDASQADGYAASFASFASHCPSIHVWVVGNEPNIGSGAGDAFDANAMEARTSAYATAYAKVHAAVHALAGHANDLVLLAPDSPYSPFCICSMHKEIAKTKSMGVVPDGYAVHAYTQAQHPSDFGSLPSLVSSEEMNGSSDGCGYPFHRQLRIYRDWIGAIEGEGEGGKPVFVTETGNACAPEAGNVCYPDQDLGYFAALYDELATWNGSATTKIRAATPYRWTSNDDGTGRDFAIGTKPGLQGDLAKAYAAGHAWTDPACPTGSGGMGQGGSSGGACTDDGACAPGSFCDLGASACTAAPSCADASGCSSGEGCVGGGCVPLSRGIASIAFAPSPASPGKSVTIDVSAKDGYTNVALAVEGPLGAGAASIPITGPDISGGANGAPFHWKWAGTPPSAGWYRATFRADPGATPYAIGYVEVGVPSGGHGGAGGTSSSGGSGGAHAGTSGSSSGGASGAPISGGGGSAVGGSSTGGANAGASGGPPGFVVVNSPSDASANDGGCGCGVVGARAGSGAWLLVAVAGLVRSRRRRR